MNDLVEVTGFFGKIPRFILRGAIKFLDWLDYHGWIPRALTLLSPFHGSLVVTSMASLGIPPIYHHLYNFGNVPMFMAFSATRHENVLDREGNVKVDGVLLDEPYLTDKARGECDIDMPYQVPEGKVFVMGDHRSVSADSRNLAIGCVSEEQIVGKLVMCVWPLENIGKLEK